MQERTVSIFDVAWAAGLYEGEGSVSRRVSNKGRNVYSQMAVTMCDEEPVRRFAAVVGVGHVSGPHKAQVEGHRERWTWAAGRHRDVRGVIDMLSPWLSGRRLEQAAAALELDERDPSGVRRVPPPSCECGACLVCRNRIKSQQHRARKAAALAATVLMA